MHPEIVNTQSAQIPVGILPLNSPEHSGKESPTEAPIAATTPQQHTGDPTTAPPPKFGPGYAIHANRKFWNRGIDVDLKLILKGHPGAVELFDWMMEWESRYCDARPDGSFYFDQKRMSQETGFSLHKTRSLLKVLEEKKLISRSREASWDTKKMCLVYRYFYSLHPKTTFYERLEAGAPLNANSLISSGHSKTASPGSAKTASRLKPFQEQTNHGFNSVTTNSSNCSPVGLAMVQPEAFTSNAATGGLKGLKTSEESKGKESRKVSTQHKEVPELNSEIVVGSEPKCKGAKVSAGKIESPVTVPESTSSLSECEEPPEPKATVVKPASFLFYGADAVQKLKEEMEKKLKPKTDPAKSVKEMLSSKWGEVQPGTALKPAVKPSTSVTNPKLYALFCHEAKKFEGYPGSPEPSAKRYAQMGYIKKMVGAQNVIDFITWVVARWAISSSAVAQYHVGGNPPLYPSIDYLTKYVEAFNMVHQKHACGGKTTTAVNGSKPTIKSQAKPSVKGAAASKTKHYKPNPDSVPPNPIEKLAFVAVNDLPTLKAFEHAILWDEELSDTVAERVKQLSEEFEEVAEWVSGLKSAANSGWKK